MMNIGIYQFLAKWHTKVFLYLFLGIFFCIFFYNFNSANPNIFNLENKGKLSKNSNSQKWLIYILMKVALFVWKSDVTCVCYQKSAKLLWIFVFLNEITCLIKIRRVSLSIRRFLVLIHNDTKNKLFFVYFAANTSDNHIYSI